MQTAALGNIKVGATTMLEIDYNQKRPKQTEDAIREMWQEVHISVCDESSPAVDRLLQALRHVHANGGAHFALFNIEVNPTFRWFMARNLWEAIELPENLLRSHVVAGALPEVCREVETGSFGFELEDGFTLSGKLTKTLVRGGAYERHQAGPGDAFFVADEFRRWLYHDRFDEVLVLRSWESWSPWFFDIAWDETWLIFDKRLSKFAVLTMTDTD